MSIYNQSIHFKNNKVLNCRIQIKCCINSFVSMLSLIKKTLKRPKGYRVKFQLTKYNCKIIMIIIQP